MLRKKSMRHASLFSGIGGAEIAASWLGWENIFHVEINPFGQKVLEYWYPKSISYEDITKTDFTRGEEKSIYSQEDSRVRRFRSLDCERERKMTATSGRRCYEQYGKYSRVGSLAKMLLDSSRLVGITFPKWRAEAIKALGNAWCVAVAYEIFRAINEIENGNK